MNSTHKSRAVRLYAMLWIAAMLISVTPAVTARAQAEAPRPPLILPIDNANFLPGAFFDVRIEVYGDERPEDFSVTINGEEMDVFFSGDGLAESWQFSAEAEDKDEFSEVDPETIETAQAMTWRQVVLPEPGVYEVVVTAHGETRTARWIVREPAASAGAKNVILFIVDGGSPAVYSAARLISRGMDAGTYGENLVFEDFEEIGFLHTGGLDSMITDSANSASAFNTGHKTAFKANGVYPDTSYDRLDDPRVEKFAYLAQRLQDMSIGIVTNAHWADATPNGVYGYGRDRTNARVNVYVTQPLDEGLLPEVILGGGARNMVPASVDGSHRDDERDLLAEYEKAGYTVVTTRSDLLATVPLTTTAALSTSATISATPAITVARPNHLLGIFHPNHMDVWLDRHVYPENVTDFPDQPDLDEMTLAALEVLGQNPNGFYLEVEGASIDKALHQLDFDRVLADTIEFDRAVAAAVSWAETNAPETLIIVTSDHAQGYDVFGTVDTARFNAAEDDSARRNAFGIHANAGFPTYTDNDGDYFPDSWTPSHVLAQGMVDNPLFSEDYQVSPVYRVPSLRAETDEGETATVDNPDDDPHGLLLGGNLPEGQITGVHTLQSVPVYAQGPGSDCFGRVQENVEVFFCMATAIGLDPAH